MERKIFLELLARIDIEQRKEKFGEVVKRMSAKASSKRWFVEAINQELSKLNSSLSAIERKKVSNVYFDLLKEQFKETINKNNERINELKVIISKNRELINSLVKEQKKGKNKDNIANITENIEKNIQTFKQKIEETMKVFTALNNIAAEHEDIKKIGERLRNLPITLEALENCKKNIKISYEEKETSLLIERVLKENKNNEKTMEELINIIKNMNNIIEKLFR
ncbi:MAG: hypothetical protein QXG86_00505 [Candidatus Woesearchaeota archaeon]